MYLLQIEHEVVNYEGWKKAFDSDPAGRKQSGVKSYKVMRLADSPNTVIIELDFASLSEAKAMLANLEKIWKQMGSGLLKDVRTRIAETVETATL